VDVAAPTGCSGTPELSQACTFVSSAFKVHYHRPDASYAGWSVVVTGGAAPGVVTSSSTDGFGAVYDLTLSPGATTLSFSLDQGGAPDAAGALSVDVSGTARVVYVFSGSAKAIPRELPAIPAADQVAVYYTRADTAYDGWGLHAWGKRVFSPTAWAVPLQATGTPDPDLGAGFLLKIQSSTSSEPSCAVGNVCVIVHKGDVKDPGPDQAFTPDVMGNIVFVTSGNGTITSSPRQAGALDIKGASAHLLASDTVAWDLPSAAITAAATTFELRWSLAADIQVNVAGTDVVGGAAIALTPDPAGLSAAWQAKVPYLKTRRAFSIALADRAALPEALKGQLVAVARDASGAALAATAVQTAWLVDELFAYDGPLGVTFDGARAPTTRLWAPTAQAAPLLHVFDATPGHAELPGSPFAMVADPAPGVWSHTGDASWYGLYYLYEVQVYHPATGKVEHLTATDPYSVSLSTNSKLTQFIDLADPEFKPAGWDALVKPAPVAPEQMVIYESHIRDFSALAPAGSIPEDHRGKYLAFTDAWAGTQHLSDLATAGLTHVHLLPAFDIATVDEDPAARVDLPSQFADLCAKNAAVPAALCGQFAGQTILQAMQGLAGDSQQQQLIASSMAGLDSFNWGYDPLHYGAPEGSYASTAEGGARVLEFRQMVQGLSSLGLRTVMDVVYNHTNASGVAGGAVLDRLVPGYYHRLDGDSGYVLTSSCCANTATEHHMMGRLMDDTLVRWAREYKVDGFRFDLMGLHLKADVMAARSALSALTMGSDGVDGSSIYLYGEGWEMGENQNNARGVNANQVNMAGTGVGTFNDRLRDAVRGGGPFDAAAQLRANQGFVSGRYLDPNELATATAADRTALLTAADLMKTSLAGGLADFRLVKATGVTVTGSQIGYNGARAGYTQDPQESINYCSAHDNQVLADILAYKLPTGTSADDRAKVQALALDLVVLGQGVPFVHMGDDQLRSKSMERDSYDSGDWFNRVDWTGSTTGWASGLPNAGKDQANWPYIRPLLADPTAALGPAQIAAVRSHFQAALRVRSSSPLFRLTTRADVMARVDFLNAGPTQVPGVVVMTITDGACAGADLDPAADGAVLIFNADKVAHVMTVPGGEGAVAHPQFPVAGASVSGADFTVPPRSAAVWMLPQPGVQGAGLACNTH
jgi:pullulanase-type alpha-1,6-glucosidase